MKKRKEIGPFPAGYKPTREGVYRTQFRRSSGGPIVEGWTYWDGKRWNNQYSMRIIAYEHRTWPHGAATQAKVWWGLEAPASS